MTRLGWINLALAAVLVAAGVVYRSELMWAAGQVDDYRRGRIDSPRERALYLEASRLLHGQRRPDAAIPLLDASIAIDPNTEAAFLRAESERIKGRWARAAPAYEAFLRIDPLHIPARRALIDTYRRLGQEHRARQTAAAGARVFDDLVRRYQPRPDRTVSRSFNRKAERVYQRYVEARDRFRALAEQAG